MRRVVLLDTGPLVAFINPRDSMHEWATSEWATIAKPYQSVPMSLADACLVRMSEQFPESTVLTLDNDFTIYRRNTNQTIPVIMSESKP